MIRTLRNCDYEVEATEYDKKLGISNDAQIEDMIRRNSKISTEKMAIALGVSSKTIKRHIKEMDNVSFVGRGFSGHWEIMDDV